MSDVISFLIFFVIGPLVSLFSFDGYLKQFESSIHFELICLLIHGKDTLRAFTTLCGGCWSQTLLNNCSQAHRESSLSSKTVVM